VDGLFLFIFLLLIVASLAHDQIAFTVLYLFLFVFVTGVWWSRQSVKNLKFRRKFNHYCFPNDIVHVRLEIKNRGWLPVLWVKLIDLLPKEISVKGSFEQVHAINPQENLDLNYQISPKTRGYYQVGPLTMTSGDLLGIGSQIRIEGEPDYLTVFPKIIQLVSPRLPAKSPIGVLRHTYPVFEDPTRVIGKREYVVGDSLRRIDWKASAAVGNLQVKLFEPSVDMQVYIMVNLNDQEYYTKFKIAASELALVTAASISNWTAQNRLPTGLYVHAKDARDLNNIMTSVPPRKGRAHLMNILETLARARLAHLEPFETLLFYEAAHLSWGTTLVLITGLVSDTLIDEILKLRLRGLNVVLIVCGDIPNRRDIISRSGQIGFVFFQLTSEKDLDLWRR
jgi:uncharacterized protein (DUF58 family)